ncbi:MAG: 30S ribosomal protein S18 [Parcubacteria group bacterium]|nr:30S ribosomal protein S18 [Parcubacteria group bacterium]
MKPCYFCQQKIQEIDYQNTDLLNQFISGQAKIISPRRTNVCAKHQRKLSKAIKKARVMGLLAFTRK